MTPHYDKTFHRPSSLELGGLVCQVCWTLLHDLFAKLNVSTTTLWMERGRRDVRRLSVES